MKTKNAMMFLFIKRMIKEDCVDMNTVDNNNNGRNEPEV